VRAKWETLSRRVDNQEVGLEAAILERVRNSSLVESVAARTIQGGSSTPPTPRVQCVLRYAVRGRGALPSAVKRRRERAVERWQGRMPV
jgi:hypothetical protein